MERYSKIYKSKWQSQYSEEFKRMVCQEYMEGTALQCCSTCSAGHVELLNNVDLQSTLLF